MDRLSGLPEEVICHVLSFLPTTSLVQTSILAKRWRSLWTLVSVLGFAVVEDSETINHFRTLFHNMTDDDDEFNSYSYTDDEDIIIFACNNLNVVIRLDSELVLPPRCLFTSETLLDLCIVDSGHIGMHGVAYNFPALKKLRLINVGYDSDTSFARLISGCPSLEELIMDRVMLNLSDYNRSILKLTRFLEANIRNMLSDKPKIRYLRIRGCEIPYIWSWNLHSLDSLIEADIDLSEDVYEREEAGDSYLEYIVMIFLPNLSNVKRLTLSTRRIVDPKSCILPDKPLDFPNLTELNLHADWCFVPIFFAHAKNLRVITIDHSTTDHHTQSWKDWFFFMTPSRMYSTSVCPMDHLETVNLVNFKWSSNQEFEMVKYIFRNANVLRTMELIYTAPHCEESDWNHKVEALDRLASFKMPSSTCSIRL